MFDEIQRDRDKLCAEVEMLKTKDALRDQRYQVGLTCNNLIILMYWLSVLVLFKMYFYE